MATQEELQEFPLWTLCFLRTPGPERRITRKFVFSLKENIGVGSPTSLNMTLSVSKRAPTNKQRRQNHDLDGLNLNFNIQIKGKNARGKLKVLERSEFKTESDGMSSQSGRFYKEERHVYMLSNDFSQ